MDSVLHALDLAGVAVFAVSGALAAGRKRMDVFGVLVLATVTGIGGGTLRDLVLGTRPVFWIAEPAYLAMCALAALATVATRSLWASLRGPLLVADALGLALFCVLGTQKALAVQVSGPVAVVMGVMTGVAGGMLRDVLSGEVPLVLRREIYATAALAGAAVYWLAARAGAPTPVPVLLGMTTALGLRLAALRFGLSLPIFEGVGEPPSR